ncbi:hypothetical protein VNO77_43664 [Canavalia gladiata]|uniref:Uncharacterized protein n=1 Tax=Canavalia gladiata TaxID=3824 RepID=A0AAN9JY62_CANGL
MIRNEVAFTQYASYLFQELIIFVNRLGRNVSVQVSILELVKMILLMMNGNKSKTKCIKERLSKWKEGRGIFRKRDEKKMTLANVKRLKQSIFSCP